MCGNNKRYINACNRDLKNAECSSYSMPSESIKRSGFNYKNSLFRTGDDALMDNFSQFVKKGMKSKLKEEFKFDIHYSPSIPGFVETRKPTH